MTVQRPADISPGQGGPMGAVPLHFNARSSSGHDMTVHIHKHGQPYTNYGLEAWEVDVDNSWKGYSREFTAGNFAGTVHDARLRFWLAPFAEAGDHYYIDDVVLVSLPVASRVAVQNQELAPEQPRDYALGQNYPNPFNPTTTISYALPGVSHVTLAVFNALGQQVAMLVQQEQGAGYYEVTFDASGLSSGIYFYRFVAGSFTETKRFILMR